MFVARTEIERGKRIGRVKTTKIRNKKSKRKNTKKYIIF